jgi:hypothetical protein
VQPLDEKKEEEHGRFVGDQLWAFLAEHCSVEYVLFVT